MKLQEKTKLAWVYLESDFVLGSDAGYWCWGDTKEVLLEMIKEEFLKNLIQEQIDSFVDEEFESYSEAYEFARGMMLGVEFSQKILAVNDAVYACEHANTVSEMNQAFLALAKEYDELLDRKLSIYVFETPYDAISLLDAHESYSGNFDLENLEEDFQNDVIC